MSNYIMGGGKRTPKVTYKCPECGHESGDIKNFEVPDAQATHICNPMPKPEIGFTECVYCGKREPMIQ